MIKQDEVPLKNNRIVSISFVVFLFSFLSFIPEFNKGLFIFMVSVCVINIPVCYYLWIKYRKQSIVYSSYTSYSMILILSLFFLIPFIRLQNNTTAFYPIILFCISFFIVTHLKKEASVIMFHNPQKSRFGKLFYIIMGLVFLFAIIVRAITLRDYDLNLLLGSVSLFSMGLLLLFFAPMMTIKPERMEEIKSQFR